MAEGTGSFKELLSEVFNNARQPAATRLVRLSGLGSDEMAAFEERCKHAKPERRRYLVASLVTLSQNNVEYDFSAVFRFALADSDCEVRLRALDGLEESEDYRLVAPLISMMTGDPAPEVRAAAAGRLGSFALLAETGKIGRSHSQNIYKALMNMVHDLNEKDEVRAEALKSVAVFSVPEITGLIERAYVEESPVMKAGAVAAMGKTCDPAWLPSIVKEISSHRVEIRRAAAGAAGELEKEESVPHLIRLTRDEVIEVKEAAIAALGQIGGEVARKVLENLSRSPVKRVQAAARAALSELSFWEMPMDMKGKVSPS
jgi:HEAT repeat protein